MKTPIGPATLHVWPYKDKPEEAEVWFSAIRMNDETGPHNTESGAKRAVLAAAKESLRLASEALEQLERRRK